MSGVKLFDVPEIEFGVYAAKRLYFFSTSENIFFFSKIVEMFKL